MRVKHERHLYYNVCNEKYFKLVKKDGHVIRMVYRNCGIPRMPESIKNLTRLKILELDSNWFNKLPIEIFTIPNLKKLISHGNRYYQFEFGKSSSLQKLQISDNIPSLPESIERLPNLINLDLSSNRLRNLPESIGRLSNLKTLELTYNNLTELPSSIKNLKKLKTLDLRNNDFTTLPESIGQLTSLLKLIISDNELTSLPENISDCNLLKIITARRNKLSTVPASLGNLENLRDLDLSINPIKTFPEELAQLKNLKIINLSNCKLKELPPFITKLRSLQKLTLNMNYLTTLPNSIKNLTSLEILRVNNNKLTKLPSEALILLPSLEYLELEYNPLPRMFLRPLRGENIRKILMSENLKNEADIEKEMIDAIENNLLEVFTHLINSGICNNVDEAIIKKIVIKAFEKGDLFLVRFLLRKGFARFFTERELKKFIEDKSTQLRKSLVSSSDYDKTSYAIPIVRYFENKVHVSKDLIDELLTEIGKELIHDSSLWDRSRNWAAPK